MKTKTERCNLRTACTKANKLGLVRKSGSNAGAIVKWDSLDMEAVFVPDDAYSKEGTLTIRPKKGEQCQP